MTNAQKNTAHGDERYKEILTTHNQTILENSNVVKGAADPLEEFFKAVLPSSGFYCVARQRKTGEKDWWEHFTFATIDEAIEKARKLDGERIDAFFHVGSLKESKVWNPAKKGGKGGWSHRTKDNVAFKRCFFADIDVGDGKIFASRDEALAGLKGFCAKVGLPKPWLVNSGGGVHAYWPFTEDVLSSDWERVARRLQDLDNHLGAVLSPERTADACSVLRVPGTNNWKESEPRPVTLRPGAGAGAVTPFEDLARIIEDACARLGVPAEVVKVRKERQAVDGVFDGVTGLYGEKRAEYGMHRCNQMKRALVDVEDVGYKLRGMVISILKTCVDGRDFEETLLEPVDDYATAKGQNDLYWSNSCSATDHANDCATFAGQYPEGCKDCKWRAPEYGITNPTSLCFLNEKKPDPKLKATDSASAPLTQSQIDAAKSGVSMLTDQADPIDIFADGLEAAQESTAEERVASANGLTDVLCIQDVNNRLFDYTAASLPMIVDTLVTANKHGQIGDILSGRIFAMLTAGRLLYVRPQAVYLRWDGMRWIKCVAGEEHQLAKRTADLILKEATSLYARDNSAYKGLFKFAGQLQYENKLLAMLSMSRSETGASIGHMEQLDADPMLVGVRNGVVDLRSGALLAPDQKMLITKQVAASYDRSAECPQWMKFLSEIIVDENDQPDFETINYLQRALGYSLTADVSEEKMFVCFGSGSNGKSCFSNVVTSIFADYQQASPPSLLVVAKNNIRNDVARTVGVRMLSINELADGDALDEQVVKQLAGSEMISARFLNHEFFDFQPTGKAWLRTNHKPRITGDDDGIWRRLVCINFRRKFTDEQKDPGLQDKLMAERDGILAWIVDGALAWRKDGRLRPSKSIQWEGNKYRSDSDVVGQFLDDFCVLDAGATEDQSVLYKVFQAFSVSNGAKAFTKKRFSQKLEERRIDGARLSGSARIYCGVRLNAEGLRYYQNLTG